MKTKKFKKKYLKSHQNLLEMNVSSPGKHFLQKSCKVYKNSWNYWEIKKIYENWTSKSHWNLLVKCMFVARGHNFLPESWKKSRNVGKEQKSWKKLRSRPPPTLKVLKLQSQIEGSSRTIFMKSIKIKKCWKLWKSREFKWRNIKIIKMYV